MVSYNIVISYVSSHGYRVYVFLYIDVNLCNKAIVGVSCQNGSKFRFIIACSLLAFGFGFLHADGRGSSICFRDQLRQVVAGSLCCIRVDDMYLALALAGLRIYGRKRSLY